MIKIFNEIIKSLELSIYLLILKQWSRLITKTKRKISKYNYKLLAEEKFLQWLKEDTEKLIEKGTFM